MNSKAGYTKWGSSMKIRDAKISDAGDLAELYRYYVENTAYTFEYAAPTAEEFSKRITGISARFPFLVCEDGGELLGFAYAHQLRERKAYQWVCETSIYARTGHARRGIGTMLYAELLPALRRQGFVKAYAVLGSANVGSGAFHEKTGFTLEATLPGIGFKLGAWHDIRYYSYELNPACGELPEPLEYRQLEKIL